MDAGSVRVAVYNAVKKLPREEKDKLAADLSASGGLTKIIKKQPFQQRSIIKAILTQFIYNFQ